MKTNTNKIEFTETYLQRSNDEFQKIAGDQKVQVRFISGTIYVYSSELGILRIFSKYSRFLEKFHFGYSENLKTWFYSMELESFI